MDSHNEPVEDPVFSMFVDLMAPQPNQKMIDWGCGNGEAALAIRNMGLIVTMIGDEEDLSEDVTKAVDEAYGVYFRMAQGSVWERHVVVDNRYYELGRCCGVLEYVPIEYLMLTVDNIVNRCQKTFFHIKFRTELLSTMFKVSVIPFSWWKARLGEYCNIVKSIDLGSSGIFIVERRGMLSV